MVTVFQKRFSITHRGGLPLQFEKPLFVEHFAQSLDFQYIFVPLIWKTSEIFIPDICVWCWHGY